MFTGIIYNIGIINFIKKIKKNNFGIRICININQYFIKKINIGDSISINGVCMTVIKKNKNSFFVDLSKESLKKIVFLNKNDKVNLEKSLKLKNYINGSLITGHIDNIGIIHFFKKKYDSYLLIIKVSNILNKYLIYKGSVIVNGISLTINDIKFKKKKIFIYLNIIPFTIKTTNLKFLKKNNLVNLEIDLISKYIKKNLNLYI